MEVAGFGQRVLSLSFSSVVGVLTLIVYLVLMPMLVFFFLKDKDLIIGWFTRFIPGERGLAARVWMEVDRQIANYVRGKFWEIVIVWAASYLVFYFFSLEYAMLLAVLVGLSVVVPLGAGFYRRHGGLSGHPGAGRQFIGAAAVW